MSGSSPGAGVTLVSGPALLNSTLQIAPLTTPGVLVNDASGNVSSNTIKSVIGWTAGAVGGSALIAGQIAGFFVVPYSGTITGWNIAVDQGTLTFKTWKIAAGTAVPTAANSINTAGLSISTGTVIESSTTSDFTTTTVTAGDIIAFTITAVASTTYASGSIKIARQP